MFNELKLTSYFTVCLFLIVAIAVSGCESPSDVGGGFVEEGAVRFDTLTVTDLEQLNYSSYSGRLPALAIGKYDDPVFGEINLVSAVKPSIENRIVFDEDLMDEAYSMQLLLNFSANVGYGDTSITNSYTLYEVTNRWRGLEWKHDSEFVLDESEAVGAFEVEPGADSVYIDLTEAWKDRFAVYYNSDTTEASDMVYREEFFGLGIVPGQNNNRIDLPQISTSTFMIISSDDTLTTEVLDWAFTLDRTDPAPQNTIFVHNNLDPVLYYDIGQVVEDYSDQDVIRAQLVFYENGELFDQTPDNHYRRTISQLEAQVGILGADTANTVQFRNPGLTGTYREKDGSYHIDFTRLFNDNVYSDYDETDLYISIPSDDGVPRSVALYNQTAAPQYTPKLIITKRIEE